MPVSVESGPSFAGIVNEGPVGPGFRLENTMPITINRFNLTGEIRFDNPQIEEIIDDGLEKVPGSSPIPAVFLEAFSPQVTAVIEHPINKAKAIWEELREQPSLTQEMLSRTLLAVDVASRTKLAPQEQVSQVLNQSSNTVLHPASFLVPIEQRIKKDKSAYVSVEERADIKKKRFVLDEHALGQRIVEITQAVRKANEWAFGLGIKITGYLVARFLPGQHSSNESEAIKGRGLDGSIPETIKDIENQGEFTSEYDAENKSLKVAYEKPPIKLRYEGEGKPVKDEDVYRVFQDLDVKPLDYDMSEQLNATKVEVRTESRIEDYPRLAEVFK